MGFFAKIRNAIARFLYGRNGMDQLGLTMLWTAIIVDVLSRLVKNESFRGLAALLSTALAVWAIWRILSKNLTKRRAENAKFLQKVWWPLKRKFTGAKQQVQDKDHKYFTCPKCSAVCRVPKGKGKIVITCPKCGNEIHGKS